jgi:hypothetical protein
MKDRLELEHQIQKEVELLRPEERLRNEIDIIFSFENGDLILFEVRPAWNKPMEIIHSPFAKASFVQSREIWRIYWMRGNLKWHPYAPAPQVGSVRKFFELVKEDKHCCFFG